MATELHTLRIKAVVFATRELLWKETDTSQGRESVCTLRSILTDKILYVSRYILNIDTFIFGKFESLNTMRRREYTVSAKLVLCSASR